MPARPASDDERLAAAYLSRVTEPAHPALWRLVRDHGLVAAADAVRAEQVEPSLRSATQARRLSADPEADLDAAARNGIRLILPTDEEWPHFALAPLRHVASHPTTHARGAEDLTPPIALWARGSGSLNDGTVRSVAVVGSRAATAYGEHIAADWAHAFAAAGVTVVSGGAFGIDAAAHRGALGAGGRCVLVSAGGLDRPYPSAHARLYDQVAASGVLLSESPPGAAPHRHRFLTRNRLIAALGSVTVIVESARRSGALNTARHARMLGRPVLAVPGPVTSAMSVGVHLLVQREEDPARLVLSAQDVLAWCPGGLLDASLPESDQRDAAGSVTHQLELGLSQTGRDLLTTTERAVLDGFPARAPATEAELSRLSGQPIEAVLAALPILLDAELVTPAREGFRLRR